MSQVTGLEVAPSRLHLICGRAMMPRHAKPWDTLSAPEDAGGCRPQRCSVTGPPGRFGRPSDLVERLPAWPAGDATRDGGTLQSASRAQESGGVGVAGGGGDHASSRHSLPAGHGAHFASKNPSSNSIHVIPVLGAVGGSIEAREPFR